MYNYQFYELISVSPCKAKNALTSRYSSIPYFEPSRPSPDCFTPPKGATYTPTGEKKQLQSYHNQFLHIILLLFLKYPPQLKLVPHWLQLFHILELPRPAMIFEHLSWIYKLPSLESRSKTNKVHDISRHLTVQCLSNRNSEILPHMYLLNFKR